MSVMAQFDLTARVAVVTGGNGGLGEAFAHALAEAGAHVVIAARDAASSRAVAEAIEANGGKAIAITADVTQQDSVAALFDGVEQQLGPVNILVNNAGICYHGAALDVTAKDFAQVFNVNVHGLWYCAQQAGERMKDRGGVIVNVGSISALIVNRPQMQPAYNASKAAVHQLTKSLAAEWAPYGIRVNALAPGYVGTKMAPVDDPKFKPRWIDDAPMQRAATPAELGPTMVYMASDASSFMTGSVVVVDGGYTLW